MKIYKSADKLNKVLDGIRKNKKIVLTGGVYDFIHYGHVDYLSRAKKMGDLLIVHVDGDDSVRKRKGFQKPIMNENYRSQVVGSLKMVDYVMVTKHVYFSSKVAGEIKPDVIVRIRRDGGSVEKVEKGEIGGARIVKLPITPKTEGISCSIICEKFLNVN